MAACWQDVLAHKAEEALGRLEDGVWSGLGLLRTSLGMDLGLEQWLRRQPPGSPTWLLAVGGVAALGLVLVLGALWALTRGLGRLLGLGKSRGSRGEQRREEEAGSGAKAGARNRDKTPGDSHQQQLRGEEQRKKSRRKERPKKSQPNGRAVAEPIEEEILQQIEKSITKQVDAERKPEKTKKSKKKPKAEMKQAQAASGTRADSKETDEGAWETKISSREKRQQRRRDKGINEASPGDSTLPAVGSEMVPTQQHVTASAGVAPRKTKGVDNTVSPGWGELSAVNGGGWSEIPVKLPAQIRSSKEDKWRPMPPTTTKGTDQPAWGQEAREPNAATKEWAVPLVSKTWGEHTLFSSIGAWTGVDGRVNPTDQKPPFSTLGMKAAVTATTNESGTTELQWEANPSSSSIDDAWSGINGISTADPSSDWNAPTEEWGNWLVEESVSTPQPEEAATEVQKVSDEEKEKVDAGAQGAVSGKSKKKKKKKKKGEDSNAPAQDAEEQEKEATNGDKEHVIQSQPEQQIVLPIETICTSESAEMRVSMPQQIKAEEAQPVTITQEPDAISESSPQGCVSQVPDALSELEPPTSTAKHNSLPPSQVKSEESWESPKQIKKKKKARRET